MFNNILELFGAEKTVRKVICKNSNVVYYYTYNNDPMCYYYDGYLSNDLEDIEFCYGTSQSVDNIPIIDLYVKMLSMVDKERLTYNSILKKYIPSSLYTNNNNKKFRYITYNISKKIKRCEIFLDPLGKYYYFKIQTKKRNKRIPLTKDSKSFSEVLDFLNRSL